MPSSNNVSFERTLTWRVAMKATALAKLGETVFPSFFRFYTPEKLVKEYSEGRIRFIESFKKEKLRSIYHPPHDLVRTLWGIDFKTPLMNAAGMFKNGECYEMTARQGAGAYLGGTGTWLRRVGNQKNGIYLPALRYPRSGAASNWLGLPNDGDEINSRQAYEMYDMKKEYRCPVGWSVTSPPHIEGKKAWERLVSSMQVYLINQVDFLEVNMSCPNTENEMGGMDELRDALAYIQKHFLLKRMRRVPVIVKFSNDVTVGQVPALMDLLFEHGFDGVNFGNTSVAYESIRPMIDEIERKYFDYFINSFGGGVSGRPLKARSLALATCAVEYVRKYKPKQEFHVIRTGGIETREDIDISLKAGISLVQWYTGYYAMFGKYQHDLYRKIWK